MKSKSRKFEKQTNDNFKLYMHNLHFAIYLYVYYITGNKYCATLWKLLILYLDGAGEMFSEKNLIRLKLRGI